MPTMPNVVGLNVPEATASLEAAGVVNTGFLGYFGTWPISIQWVPLEIFTWGSLWGEFLWSQVNWNQGAGVNNEEVGIVSTQLPLENVVVTVNSPITLTVFQYPIAVVYP